MLFRSIDLLTGQPRVAEVQEAELRAIVRRLAEYNVCTDRLAVGANGSHREGFCQRRAGFGPSSAIYRIAQSAWVGPQSFPQVEQSWKTAWVYRPEAEVETASGYSFDPAVMRPQFKLGARTFQSRCREMPSCTAFIMQCLSTARPAASRRARL